MNEKEIASYLATITNESENTFRALTRAYWAAKYGDFNTAHAALIGIDFEAAGRHIQTATYYLKTLEDRKEHDNAL